MNDIQIRSGSLPALPEELAKFILVGEEKARAIKAEIRAIQKLNLANEVWHQKQEELEMVREAVIEAERRIGVLFNNMPKQTGRTPGNQHTGRVERENEKTADVAGFSKTRKEAAADLGFKEREVRRFQQMAKHPEAIEQAKVEARENGTDLTTQSVLNKIRQQDKPVDLRQYAAAKADEDYYQAIEDERLSKQLDKALDGICKLIPTDAESHRMMYRGDFDRVFTASRLKESIERLQAVLVCYMKGGK